VLSSSQLQSPGAPSASNPAAQRGGDPLPYLLGSSTPRELRYRLSVSATELTLIQAQTLSRHLGALPGPAVPLRVGIVHTYTSDLLDPWLRFEALLQGLAPDIYHAPYGVTAQAGEIDPRLAAHAPDITLLMMRWEDIDPDLARPLSLLDGPGRIQLAERVVVQLVALLGKYRANLSGQAVLTLLPSLGPPGLGEYDSRSEASEGGWRAGVKTTLAAQLRDNLPGAHLLDLDESLMQIGRQRFFDLRFWYSARFPFAPIAARELARRVVALGAVIKLPKAKVIALDADNTLWGGTIGEDGMNGIALGPDYPGNAYLAFQRRLLDFQQRGFVLALCSKNNPEDLLEVLREHPHQILKEEHFAALRVNWAPKPENLRSLAEELNLNLDSFIFVDDSAHECLAVQSELPGVEVVKTPERPQDIASCLDRVARLEVLALTDEDRQKTLLYKQESRRRDLAESNSSPENYLKSLDMRMRIRFDDESALARLAQLTQKTNQFNLTTRRYGETEVLGFMNADDWLVAHFSLADIFGDSGIVGLALIRVGADATAALDTFLMSCRVIGREAESAFLDALLRTLQRRGVRSLRARYLPTAKNKLVEDFLPRHGFVLQEDGGYSRDLSAAPPADESAHPIRIDLP
jgi:FkbH-like protein